MRRLLGIILSLMVPSAAYASPVYYVSPTGSDSNDGLSPATAWQTIAKVNGFTFPAASTINFQGGQTFSGCLAFTGYGTGNVAAGGPTLVTSYGTGQAEILSTCTGADTKAVLLDGVDHFTLKNMNIQGGTLSIPPGAYQFFASDPSSAAGPAGAAYSLGRSFTVDVSATATGGALWKSAADTTTSRRFNLWQLGNSTALASCTTSNEPTGSAVQVSCNFSSAYTLTANVQYALTADIPNGSSFSTCTPAPGSCATGSNLPMFGAGIYAVGLDTLPSSTNGYDWPVTPLITTTATAYFPLTPIGVEIENNGGTTHPSTYISVIGSTVQNFAGPITGHTCEICVHGDSLSGVNGPLDHVSLLNNVMGGTQGPNSPDSFGITGYGYGLNVTNVNYSGNKVSNLGGWPYSGPASYSNGIIADGVNVAMIENNVVHDIGAFNTTCGGPDGVEAYSGNAITMQFNEVYNVQPTYPNPRGCDWDAYDLDGGVTNSTVQYNYSHHNWGSAWLAYTASFSTQQWGNNTFRYNISENDGMAGAGGNNSVFTLASGGAPPNPLKVYGNTIYMKAVYASGGYNYCYGGYNFPTFPAGSFIKNNICWVDTSGSNGVAPFVNLRPFGPSSGITWDYNTWYTAGATTLWEYNNADNRTFTAWQTASGGDANGSTADPKLASPGNGGTLNWDTTGNVCSLLGPTAYTLLPSSPVLSVGADLLACPAGGSSSTLGPMDYFGHSISALCGS